MSAEASPVELGRRDFAALLMWIVAALFGRWKIPAQLAPAAELVQREIFKGGTLKISVLIKGWEMPPSLKAMVDAETREKVFSDEQFREQFARSLQVGFKRGEEVHDGPIAAG